MVNTRSVENVPETIGKIALMNQFIDSVCNRLLDTVVNHIIESSLETETLNNQFINSVCARLLGKMEKALKPGTYW